MCSFRVIIIHNSSDIIAIVQTLMSGENVRIRGSSGLGRGAYQFDVLISL